jgi:1,4-alpha-glucan branching enzyme
VNIRFVLMLHSHLPWVLHHGRWPHGADWLCEATVDSYLPLLHTLDRMETDNTAMPITLGITPILAAQFAHPAFAAEVERYLDERMRAVAEAPASLAASGELSLIGLVSFWRNHYHTVRATWQRHDGDLIAGFDHHARAGRIELITSAATHGFLPLLARDESVRLQLLVGWAEHVRHFGRLPRGCWLPECGYRPRGTWHPLPSAREQPARAGLEDHLQHAGFDWFVVDAHLLDAGEVVDPYAEPVPAARTGSATRSPYRIYQVQPTRGRPLRLLVRDPASSARVWSRAGGYPGDARYLEFHKQRSPGGLRLWAVTNAGSDLGAKKRYAAAAAARATSAHAAHFHELLQTIAATADHTDHVITAPFDTELFGHWWFEGVDFLRDVYQDFGPGDPVIPSTADAALAAEPRGAEETIPLAAGSWGANGDWSMWLNPRTEWLWERLWPLEERFWDVVPRALELGGSITIIEQAARELLLAQSSDWPFIITNGSAGDYGARRFAEHCNALDRLVDGLEHPDDDGTMSELEAYAAAMARLDGPFADLFGAVAAASDVKVA